MSNNESRFTAQNKTTQQRLSSNTVGLVNLSDYRKRRAEVLEQQEREAREGAASGGSGTPIATPDRSATATPDHASDASGPKKKKAKKAAKSGGSKLSFGDDDEEEEGAGGGESSAAGSAKEDGADSKPKSKFKANASVAVAPRSMTKSALRREAAEREVLRREFLAKQEAVKASEIAVPFVFYDGGNIPGGKVRVKKGDFIWVFLDKSRKVGAELGVGEKANAAREWARVGVDDLMMVRGNIIIPHHFDFLFFIMNKTLGPNDKPLFEYSAEPPQNAEAEKAEEPAAGLVSAAAVKSAKVLSDINTLEGASDDPTLTKVVDRRWYERNKHIYPASMWQEFDPEKDYRTEVRRDLGGNAFFYS